MLCTLLHLYCHIAVVLEVLGQPDSREVAPTELLNDDVAIEQDFSDVDRMVATYLIIRHALILARILVIEKSVVNLLFQRSEIWPVELASLTGARVGRDRPAPALVRAHEVVFAIVH